MNKLKLVLAAALILFAVVPARSQVSVSFYSSSISKAGLAYNFNKRIWTELRLYAYTMIEDVTPELVICYNLVSRENHNIYIGAGATINLFTGPVLPVGVQFSPFDGFKRFSFHVEFQPSMDIPEGDPDIILQASGGFRYRFGKDQ